jgi:hypothetical protein
MEAHAMTSTKRKWLPNRWWRETEDEAMARALVGTADSLRSNCEGEVALMRSLMEAYEASDTPLKGNDERGLDVARRKRNNLIFNAVDMVSAWITKATLRPMVVTTAGDIDLIFRAEDLSLYIDGVVEDTGAREELKTAYLDHLVIGTGYVSCMPTDGRVVIERIKPDELFVAKAEREAGAVRSVYRTKTIDRGVLCEMFPDASEAIEYAEGRPDEDGHSTDLVEVWEAWHLPSAKGAKDGLHCIAIDSAMLLREEWTRDDFPIVRITSTKRVGDRWYGLGYGERLAGAQNELDWVAERVSSSFARGVNLIGVFGQCDVDFETITNNPAQIVRFSHAAPGDVQFMSPAPVHPSWLERESAIVDSAMAMNGLSQIMASGQTPEALANSSGKALLVHEDLQGGRLHPASEAWENAHRDLYRLVVAASEDLYDAGETDHLEAMVGQESMRRIAFGDVRLDQQVCRIRVYPVSALSHSPAGRFDEVEKLMGAGLITDREQALDLLAMPDLEKFNRQELGWQRYVREELSAALRDHTPPQPDALLPAQPAIELARKIYLWARKNGGDELGLSLVRDFIAQLQAVLAAQQPPMPPQPAAPMPMPPEAT